MRLVSAAVHGVRTYLLVQTHHGCRCMLELSGEFGARVPADGAIVKVYGMTLGIPGFTALRLMAMEIEERA